MRTAFHIDEIYLRHRTPDGHPERAARIESLLAVAERVRGSGVSVESARRDATPDELARVHDADYVDAIASTAGRDTMLDPDTFTSPDSFEVACRAAGAVLDAVDGVVAGDYANAFVALRPPGHHAERDRAMGFCLFNNVAVGAAHALGRLGLERVAVIDWDVHHGNGTQEIFWENPGVLFVSLHQFPFYPGTGSARETGGGNGAGRTVNIPMAGGFGDEEYAAAFRLVVGPVVRAFDPSLVMVSAGFDAHMRDPLGGMRVSEAGFDAMTAAVSSVARECCHGRVVAVLEGGYDLAALASCTETVLNRLRDFAATPVAEIRGEGAFAPVLHRVRAAQAAHWQL